MIPMLREGQEGSALDTSISMLEEAQRNLYIRVTSPHGDRRKDGFSSLSSIEGQSEFIVLIEEFLRRTLSARELFLEQENITEVFHNIECSPSIADLRMASVNTGFMRYSSEFAFAFAHNLERQIEQAEENDATNIMALDFFDVAVTAAFHHCSRYAEHQGRRRVLNPMKGGVASSD